LRLFWQKIIEQKDGNAPYEVPYGLNTRYKLSYKIYTKSGYGPEGNKGWLNSIGCYNNAFQNFEMYVDGIFATDDVVHLGRTLNHEEEVTVEIYGTLCKNDKNVNPEFYI
jgi:hypothetical protein